MDEYLFDLSLDENLIVAGSDEAGRGPLAGPVVASTVVLPSSFPFEILNDSKKLSKKEREYAERIILDKALSFGIYEVSSREIDRINILKASLKAMRESYLIASKKMKIDILLVDGNKTPEVDIPCRAIVKGDSKIHEIMAASILAKCYRDRLMEEYDDIYPEYGFKENKGYPTKKHFEAIKKYGPSPIHRMTFSLYGKKNREKTLL